MTLLLQIVAARFLRLGSAVLLGILWRNDQREDLGSVTPGYRREKGWWPR